MELAIPLIALGGLFVISNQNKNKSESEEGEEHFQNIERERNRLPNTNIPNKNYPDEYPVTSIETDLTSELSNANRYDSQSAYTDKYFNANMNSEKTGAKLLPDNSNGNAISQQYRSMTGELVDKDYYRHNNMAPYFGGRVRNNNLDYDSYESILDNYSGAGSQTISKKEQSPLFTPAENVQWSHGLPNMNDFFQSRVNPSTSMANVKPFQEQHVAPGLGLGYTTEGAGGFNSGMMSRELWNEKNVDELRVASKPKSSGHMLYSHEGPAISHITNPGIMGAMEKNRVDTSFELGQDRLFTTTGLEKAPTMRAEQIDRYVNRPETTTDYTGVAGYSNSNTYTTGEFMPSTRIELDSVPIKPAGANGMGGIREADYGIKSKVAYPNNRSSVKNDGYFGVVGGAIGEAIAPLMDILRPSRKENTIGSLRPYQNAKSAVPSSYVYNPENRIAPTIRETTEVCNYTGVVNRNQDASAYLVTGHDAPITNRQITSDYYYAGNASAGERSRVMKSYEAEYNQRNNDIKSSTIQGYMVQGNMSLMNGDINMRQKTLDSDLRNTRALASSGIVTQSPDIANIGRVSGAEPLYQNIQLDRNEPEIMNMLQQNPFAIPYRAK